jgi:hypothetical protein
LAKITQLKPQNKLLMWGLNGNSEFQNSEFQTLSQRSSVFTLIPNSILMAPLTKMCLTNPYVMCQKMASGREP